MGVTAVVFEEGPAPTDGDLWDWISAQRAAESKGEWRRPETSSNVLNLWFSDMRETFPSLPDAHPDDVRGTDYTFYKHFVYIDFAGPVSEEGVVTAWKLAHKHGLRILVGDELLPRSAPEGKRQLRITALDGSEVRAHSTIARNLSIAILDPTFAPASGTKKWVLDQLEMEWGGDNLPSIIGSSLLKQWNNEFGMLNVSCAYLEKEFFKNVVLLHFHPKDLDKIAPAVIELAKRLRLGLLFFENLEGRRQASP